MHCGPLYIRRVTIPSSLPPSHKQKGRVCGFGGKAKFFRLEEKTISATVLSTMVRTKVEIKRIEDKAKRHTTFTKRRQGLFKKTKELVKRCDAQAAVITFSLAGNVFAFGHPSVDVVVNRYIAATSAPEHDEVPVHEEAEKEERDAVIETAGDEETLSFKQSLKDMGMDELEELNRTMEEMKKKVVDKINGIISSSKN